MNLKKSLFVIVALSIPALLFLEVAGRNSPKILARMAEKKAHRVASPEPFVRLEPGVHLTLENQAGKPFLITTDRKGLRIVPGNEREKKCSASIEEIWLMGDSIAMGYGLDDNRTPGYYLHRTTGCPVKVVAVDGNGALALENDLDRMIKESNHPDRIVARWIFHPSDFIDDPVYLNLKGNRVKILLRRIHFALGKTFAGYWLVLDLLRSGRNDPNGLVHHREEAMVPSNHPTLQAAYRMGKLASRRGLDFAVIFYPDGDVSDQPAPLDSLKKQTMESFESSGLRVFNISEAFFNYKGTEKLYQKGDGHPSEAGAMILGAETARKIGKKPYF